MEFENDDSIMIISTEVSSKKVLPTPMTHEIRDEISLLPISPVNIIDVSTENVSAEISEACSPKKQEGFIPMDHLHKDIFIVTLLALLFLKSLFDLVRCLRRKKNRPTGHYPMGSMGSEVTIFDTSKLK